MNDVPLDEAAARRKLDSERDRLQGLVSELQSETRPDDTSAAGDDIASDQHRVESGSETFEQEKDLAILESLETELAEVEAALRRLDEGTYGIDEVTGEPIDPARLDARPEARTNVDTERS
jgi:RNA polymerase-binding transcription factor DksA